MLAVMLTAPEAGLQPGLVASNELLASSFGHSTASLELVPEERETVFPVPCAAAISSFSPWGSLSIGGSLAGRKADQSAMSPDDPPGCFHLMRTASGPSPSTSNPAQFVAHPLGICTSALQPVPQQLLKERWGSKQDMNSSAAPALASISASAASAHRGQEPERPARAITASADAALCRSDDMEVEDSPFLGLSSCRLASSEHTSSSSRLLRSASAAELYNVPDGRVRAGKLRRAAPHAAEGKVRGGLKHGSKGSLEWSSSRQDLQALGQPDSARSLGGCSEITMGRSSLQQVPSPRLGSQGGASASGSAAAVAVPGGKVRGGQGCVEKRVRGGQLLRSPSKCLEGPTSYDACSDMLASCNSYTSLAPLSPFSAQLAHSLSSLPPASFVSLDRCLSASVLHQELAGSAAALARMKSSTLGSPGPNSATAEHPIMPSLPHTSHTSGRDRSSDTNVPINSVLEAMMGLASRELDITPQPGTSFTHNNSSFVECLGAPMSPSTASPTPLGRTPSLGMMYKVHPSGHGGPGDLVTSGEHGLTALGTTSSRPASSDDHAHALRHSLTAPTAANLSLSRSPDGRAYTGAFTVPQLAGPPHGATHRVSMGGGGAPYGGRSLDDRAAAASLHYALQNSGSSSSLGSIGRLAAAVAASAQHGATPPGSADWLVLEGMGSGVGITRQRSLLEIAEEQVATNNLVAQLARLGSASSSGAAAGGRVAAAAVSAANGAVPLHSLSSPNASPFTLAASVEAGGGAGGARAADIDVDVDSPHWRLGLCPAGPVSPGSEVGPTVMTLHGVEGA